MKVLIVGPYSSPIIQRLVKHLKDIGYEVLVASHNAKDSDSVVSLGNLNSFFGYFNFFKIRKIVKSFQPDLVHAHVVNHYGLMSIMHAKPLVLALWGSDIMLAPHSGSLIKRFIYKTINRLVLKRASRCHTSGFHVAEEAERQCKGVIKRTDVFYWGFPIEKSSNEMLNSTQIKMEKEFGLIDDGLVVFPRGLGSVYNPKIAAVIINKLIKKTDLGKKIVVLKGFANARDEENFKKIADIDSITYIDRLLTNDELYFLYSRTDIHFSIPFSDSLGGGVVEPALFGSYPVLSNLPSYRKYAEKNNSFILESYESKNIDLLCEQINSNKIGKSIENIPKDYTLQSVLENIKAMYKKTKV